MTANEIQETKPVRPGSVCIRIFFVLIEIEMSSGWILSVGVAGMIPTVGKLENG